MNQGQERFLNFILEKVKEDEIEVARMLLEENFKKQAEGTFTREDAITFSTKIISLIKPENIDEVQTVMKQFSNNM